jgi:predicted nucleotidyltransferase
MPLRPETTALERLIARQTAQRAATASVRARCVIDRLRQRGVEARLVGWLARGDFMAHSDVDLLILSCPYELKYTLESLIEDEMLELPFDCIYLDEVRPPYRERLLAEARGAPACG